ncbi:DUF928 domain-containing protein [Leptothoe spongobia]|uniref:DUF928 domain-containing protein n=1 Tax=Leptothoe spongobia TAU-MAC 1115 TaxID=1967444 RepID=A0A947DCS2_9CYAN|nr:DUF928 domain-containing protein [Leptothoe spongobia]MBT9314009.1 DUF928 domain-containing protein [Leptothoe spongobia TAU-MAC 1115]
MGGIQTIVMDTAHASKAVSPSIAQTPPSPSFNFSQNFDPPGDGRPDTSRGSGARTGSCTTTVAESTAELTSDPDTPASNHRRIRPVMPSGNFGLTWQDHPTVFINFDGIVAPFVVLRFEDQAGDYSERVTVSIDPEHSIQGFSLPNDRPPLAIGKNYKWTLLVACDGQVNPNHPIFSGWVQRVATTETTTLIQQQSVPEQISWYTSQGYWYEAVVTLHQALQTNPTDRASKTLWTQLLEFVDQE